MSCVNELGKPVKCVVTCERCKSTGTIIIGGGWIICTECRGDTCNIHFAMVECPILLHGMEPQILRDEDA